MEFLAFQKSHLTISSRLKPTQPLRACRQIARSGIYRAGVCRYREVLGFRVFGCQ